MLLHLSERYAHNKRQKSVTGTRTFFIEVPPLALIEIRAGEQKAIVAPPKLHLRVCDEVILTAGGKEFLHRKVTHVGQSESGQVLSLHTI